MAKDNRGRDQVLGSLFKGFGNDMRTSGGGGKNVSSSKSKDRGKGDGNNRITGNINKDLGPAVNPLQGIIQGLAYQNPLAGNYGGNTGNYAKGTEAPNKVPELFPGLGDMRPAQSGFQMPSIQPKASMDMRSFIAALMDRDRQRNPQRYG